MKTTSESPVTFGEYKVTQSIKAAKTTSVPSSIPAATDDFTQFQQVDTQFAPSTTKQTTTTTENFQFFQGDANLDNEEFATVNVLQSDGTTSDIKLNQIDTAATTNTDFTTKTETKITGFENNAQFDFGASNTGFETNTTNIVDTNTFNTENATTNLEGMDFNTNTQAQFGEFQTESAQAMGDANFNLGEAFGKTETTTTTTTTNIENMVDTGANYNANTFQSVEPNVDTNNFDFTSSNSIVGATSALNDFNVNANFGETNQTVDTGSAFNAGDFTATQTTTTTTTTSTTNMNLTNELVDPNPIQVSTNFATDNQQASTNEIQTTDLNAFTLHITHSFRYF